MDFLINLWYDDNIRQLLLGLLATAIISVMKFYSEKVANSNTFKYCAVFMLSACGATYAEIWEDGVFEVNGFISNFISIVAFSIGGYQTIGKAAKGLFEKYTPKKEVDSDELV